MTKHRVSQLAVIGLVGMMGATRAGLADEATQPSFYSLKSNPVNLRKGPGTQYPKSWVFRRAGLPVEVLRAHGRWREVRDSDGATGWVLQTLISRRRTALVAPWKLKEPETAENRLITLRASARARAGTVAKLEPGTLVSLKTCDGTWCYVSIQEFRGHIEQNLLWGIYPNETLK